MHYGRGNMTPQLTELPPWIFWTIGVLVVGQFGTLAAVWMASVKLSFSMGKIFHSIKHQLEENTKDIDSAHMKIRGTNETVTKIKEKLIHEGIIGA